MQEFKLTDIVNSLLKNRHIYKTIPVKVKDDNFFIINRLLSKEYPEQAQRFNKKTIDKSLALDLWFLFLRHKDRNKIYKWFWSKVSSNNKKISDSDSKSLMDKFSIKKEDIDILILYHIDFIEEELKYIKELKNNV